MLFIKVFTDLPHHRPFRIAIGLYDQMPYMKFLFVRSDICRQLPSDFTSRWTPLPLTMQFPLLGLARDFHPLDNAHAEASKKKTDGWDSNHRSLYRYVLLCDYLLTTRRSLIRAFLPVRLRR